MMGCFGNSSAILCMPEGVYIPVNGIRGRVYTILLAAIVNDLPILLAQEHFLSRCLPPFACYEVYVKSLVILEST